MVMAMGRGDIKRFGGDGGPKPGIGAGLRGFAKPGGVCIIAPRRRERGRSSGVEHNLAKVGVEGSNPFARSRFQKTADSYCAARSFATSAAETADGFAPKRVVT